MNPGKKQKTKKYKSTSKEETGPTHESTSLQAPGRRNQGHKPRVQASSPSLQAQGSGNPDRGERPQAPGYKLPGQMYFFYASDERISGAGRTALSWVLMGWSFLIQQ